MHKKRGPVSPDGHEGHPLGMGREKFLFERFIVTARSTLKVTLIIGGIQGVLGGIVFFATDVEGR